MVNLRKLLCCLWPCMGKKKCRQKNKTGGTEDQQKQDKEEPSRFKLFTPRMQFLIRESSIDVREPFEESDDDSATESEEYSEELEEEPSRFKFFTPTIQFILRESTLKNLPRRFPQNYPTLVSAEGPNEAYEDINDRDDTESPVNFLYHDVWPKWDNDFGRRPIFPRFYSTILEDEDDWNECDEVLWPRRLVIGKDESGQPDVYLESPRVNIYPWPLFCAGLGGPSFEDIEPDSLVENFSRDSPGRFDSDRENPSPVRRRWCIQTMIIRRIRRVRMLVNQVRGFRRILLRHFF